MGKIDPTIDALVQELVQKELPPFDPAKVEWVSEIPLLAPGLHIVRIGSVRDIVVCAIKKGAQTLCVLAAGVSIWEAFVFAATLFTPNSLPGAIELAKIIRTGTVQVIEEFPKTLIAQQQHTYFVVREQLPSDLELVSGNSEPLPDNGETLGPIALTTAMPSSSPDQRIAAAGPLPTTGNLSGTISFGFTVGPAQLKAYAMAFPPSDSDGVGLTVGAAQLKGYATAVVPEDERLALVSSTGITPTTMQNAVPLKFGVEDHATVRTTEDIQIRTS